MKRKYKCHSCKHENIVDIEDIITMGLGGMGGLGVMATEMGLGGMMSNSNIFGGNNLPFRIPNGVKEFKHNCNNCGQENILKIT